MPKPGRTEEKRKKKTEEKTAEKTAVLCCAGTGALRKAEGKKGSGQLRKLPPAAREVHKQ